MNPTPSALSFRDLACIRGERVLFAGLTGQVAAGDALRLIGPNGSGKTSLLRLLAGLAPPAHGDIAWHGKPIRTDAAEHRARVLFVGHLDAVKPYLTVRENIAFWAGLYGRATSIDAAVAALDLASLAGLPARFLSAGQRRRANLARLFVTDVPLWLLDEPTTSLDERSIGAVEAAIARHRAGGGLAVVATHTPIRLDAATELDFGKLPSLQAA
ncbi:MAG: heme ABC exporter ATP-binding protein CcmA [Alphaproteobacteria bacterium]